MHKRYLNLVCVCTCMCMCFCMSLCMVVYYCFVPPMLIVKSSMCVQDTRYFISNKVTNST